ncbi:hypothetical protein HDU92_007771 [Lobulomyces angularis]|nr:hypothetical protein HDU92_007771 [Lobulomyces angularis]
MSSPIFRHSSDIDSSLDYKRILDIINDDNFTISDTNSKDNVLKEIVHISLDDIKTYVPPQSSQHIVFFGKMKFLSNEKKIDICIKFKKPYNRERSNDKETEIIYGNYTQKHYSYVMYNYNKANEYLSSFKGKDMIKINNVFCCKTVKKYPTKYDTDNTSVCFWVESRLSHFDTYWDEGKMSYIDRILTTNVDILKEFQIHIYNKSGYDGTIIDLQGNLENNVYILCDIEFTSNNLYEFTSSMMIDRIITLYGLETVNLKDLSDRVGNIEKDVVKINNRLDKIEDKMDKMENKIDILSSQITQLFNFLVNKK